MKITGKRGMWTAKIGIDEEEYPVVHDTHINWKNRTYREGNNSPWENSIPAPPRRWAEHMERIRRLKTVIVQKDKSSTDPTRTGYIGVFLIDNVKIDGDVITFDFVGRR